MSEDGRARCHELAERLSVYKPKTLLASTEPKARETADLIGPALGLEVQLADGLRETARRTVGWLERDELERRIRELFDRPDEVVYGEESAAEALARFELAVTELPEPAVVVSHGTVISLFAASRTGRDPFMIWRALELPDVVEA